MIFEKALQNRSLPRDRWPKKISGQSFNIRMMNMVEDFYNLEETCDDDDYGDTDHFAEAQDPE